MYRYLRVLYRILDLHVIARLPKSVQHRLRSLTVNATSRWFPRQFAFRHESQLRPGPMQASPWAKPALPTWINDDLKELSEIDPAMHPAGEWISSAQFHAPAWSFDEPGRIYAGIRSQLLGHFDVILVVPWLKVGGADLGALHFANTLCEHFGLRVLVLATEPASSPWSERLNSRVQFLPIGAALASITDEQKLAVLVRLILQLAPSTVHVINSKLGWEAIRRHGLALRQVTHLYASLFCDDYSDLGLPVGYARRYLPLCYSRLSAVITDNTVVFRQWVREIGVPESIFRVIPFPAPTPVTTQAPSNGARKRLLWAGRLDRQKRPELVIEIARQLPDFIIDVWGGYVVDESNASILAMIRSKPNIEYHGFFDQFTQIVAPNHLAFLYTTAWDGLPTILLDAAAAGLPIIAPGIGGVPDIVPAAQLVSSDSRAEDYCRLVRALELDQCTRDTWIRAQRERLAAHTQESFVAHIRELLGYLPTQPCLLSSRDSGSTSFDSFFR